MKLFVGGSGTAKEIREKGIEQTIKYIEIGDVSGREEK